MNLTKTIKSAVQHLEYYMGKTDAKNTLPHPKNLGHGYIDVLNQDTGYRFRMYGGSFYDAPVNTSVYTVKLEKMIQVECDQLFPIRDFSVPSLVELIENVDKILNASRSQVETYIGCMGGFGRTGTVASAVLMVATKCTAHQAIDQIRANIHPHCVETRQQVEFLEEFGSVLAIHGFAALKTLHDV
ncbi:putative protein-tyrosine phosphatase [Vibrio phage vB_VpS_PG28]|nr:putative protein-tyrosine phosphatase [Vibrio phage vB_VpS_PG28]